MTCLFIASKIEEIYPPKLQEFAYVTDGACSEEEILQMELVVLKTLNWSLSPITANAWAKYLLQLEKSAQELNGEGQVMMCLNDENVNHPQNGEEASTSAIEDRDLVQRAFSTSQLCKIMHLLDLCTLDIQSLNFSNASLAACAMLFCRDGLLPTLPKSK